MRLVGSINSIASMQEINVTKIDQHYTDGFCFSTDKGRATLLRHGIFMLSETDCTENSFVVNMTNKFVFQCARDMIVVYDTIHEWKGRLMNRRFFGE